MGDYWETIGRSKRTGGRTGGRTGRQAGGQACRRAGGVHALQRRLGLVLLTRDLDYILGIHSRAIQPNDLATNESRQPSAAALHGSGRAIDK